MPAVNRATRQRQYFWVNGRPIRSGFLSIAVERAYGGLLPPGRHPVIALGLTLPAEFLDVNVHPRKTEIHFLQERAVFAAVQEAVEQVMQQYPLAAGSWEEGSDFTAWTEQAAVLSGVGEEPAPYAPAGQTAAPLLQPLGQVGNTFVIANGPQGLLVLDQHAAHERLLYDRLWRQKSLASNSPKRLSCTSPRSNSSGSGLPSRCYRVCSFTLSRLAKQR